MPKDLSITPTIPNPKYADLTGVGVATVLLNLFFNGTKEDAAATIEAARQSEAH